MSDGGCEMGGCEMGGCEMGGCEMGGCEMGGCEMGECFKKQQTGKGEAEQKNNLLWIYANYLCFLRAIYNIYHLIFAYMYITFHCQSDGKVHKVHSIMRVQQLFLSASTYNSIQNIPIQYGD